MKTSRVRRPRTASFTVTADLPHTPQQTWRLITDPEWMNTWSAARIDLVDAGVGDRPDGVGALRTVTLPNGRTRLKEVVEESEYPHRFVYRVFDGGPALLAHRGVQEITATPDGSRLTWTVDIGLIARLASEAMARSMARQVGYSVDLIAGVAPPQESPPPPAHARGAARDLADLRAAAELTLAAQRGIADRLASEGDPKQWFARVYEYVTDEMIGACAGRGTATLDHPEWVLSLIPVFDRYYTRSLQAFEQGEACEPAWQKAWSMCEREDPDDPARPVMAGLLAGVSAHIDADLPRALVDVHRESFPDRDFREFRPDYLRLAPVFTAASDRLIADLPRSHTPWWTSAATRIHPQVRDSLLARRGYDVGKHRIRAFAAAADSMR